MGVVAFERPGAGGASPSLAPWGRGPRAKPEASPAVEIEQLWLRFAPAESESATASSPAPRAILVATLPVGRAGWVERWRVASATREGVAYTVARRSTGEMGCSCPGWIYHGSRPRCRHIQAVLEAGR